MYTYEIATIGSSAGVAFDHAADLEAAGYCLGAGAAGTKLSLLHVEGTWWRTPWRWSWFPLSQEGYGGPKVLSHTYGVYTPLADTAETVTTQGYGGTRGKGTDFVIPPDHRVVSVCADFAYEPVAGLKFFEINMVSVTDPEPTIITRSTGSSSRASYMRQWHNGQVGTYDCSHGTGYCRVVDIPEGLTLAGIAGRTDESWNQMRLLVSPWLPEGGAWSPSIHKHLVQPFREQVRSFLLCLHHLQHSGQIPPLHASDTANLVAALFKVTFLSDQPPQLEVHHEIQPEAPETDVGGSNPADYVGSWIEREVEWARQDGLEVVVGPQSRNQEEEEEDQRYDRWRLYREYCDSLCEPWISKAEQEAYGECEEADEWEYEMWKRARPGR